MQLRGQTVRVGEARQVERLLSPLSVLPGQPVLDYEPERDIPAAVFLDYRDKLVGAFVTLLRLTVAVSPLRQQRRASGQQTVAAMDVADISAGDEVVIELVDRVAPDVLADLGILEGHERPAVEQEAVALGRYERRHAGFHVVLIEVAVMTTQVADSLLVRAEAVERLV